MLLNNRSHAKDGFRGKDSSILLMLAPPESFFVSKKTTAVRTDFFIKKSKASTSEQLQSCAKKNRNLHLYGVKWP